MLLKNSSLKSFIDLYVTVPLCSPPFFSSSLCVFCIADSCDSHLRPRNVQCRLLHIFVSDCQSARSLTTTITTTTNTTTSTTKP